MVLAQAGLAAADTAYSLLLPTLSNNGSSSGYTGQVTLTTVGTGITIKVQAQGLPSNSEHAFHVHVFGDVSDNLAGLKLGGHYNPKGFTHACINATRDATTGYYNLPSSQYHAGDFGVVKSDAYGAVDMTYFTSELQISNPGLPFYLPGRGFSLHLQKDSCFGSVTDTGMAGARSAQSVIALTSNVAFSASTETFASVIGVFSGSVAGSAVVESSGSVSITVSKLSASTDFIAASSAIGYFADLNACKAAIPQMNNIAAFKTDASGSFNGTADTNSYSPVQTGTLAG
ncbi:hypothetical protein HDU80_005315, partial [Chytriomyces hyalinus]